MRAQRISLVGVILLAITAGSVRGDAPFDRGDTNNDGSVDVIDAVNILTHLFHNGPQPSCMDAWDSNDDGNVNIADAVYIIQSTCAGGPSFSPPTGEAGEDPTDDPIGCADNPESEPIVEQDLHMWISDVTIAGGADPTGVTTVYLTTDRPVLGLEVTLRVEGIDSADLWIVGYPEQYDYIQSCVDNRRIAIIPSILRAWTLEPGEALPLCDVGICLPQGTEAGTYQLVLENARLSLEGDYTAHLAQASGAALQLESAVTVDGCTFEDVRPDNPERPALENQISYELQSPGVVAEGTEEFTVVFFLSSNPPVLSFDVAIDFNEYVLELTNVATTLRVDGLEPAVYDVLVGPSESTSPSNTVQNGYVVLHGELGSEAVAKWSRDTKYEAARLTFRSLRTDVKWATIKFRTVGPHQEYANQVRCRTGEDEEKTISPRKRNAFVLLNADGEVVPPPMVDRVEDVEATFRLSEASGRPGDTEVPIEFYIETNTAIMGFSMAFSYDREVLRVETFTSLAHIYGREPDFLAVDTWTPDDPDFPHGVAMGMVASLLQEFLYYPEPDEPVAQATFTILDSAPEGTESLLTFEDETIGSPAIDNVVVFGGLSIAPDMQETEVHITRAIHGRVKVMAETTIFLRGDANGDEGVDVADAVQILLYLFRDGDPSLCPDAADANDDGNINVADPIAILLAIFIPGYSLPAPYPERGKDETADLLGSCIY